MMRGSRFQIGGLSATLVLATAAIARAASVVTFDDITYWVGEGANRAAIVIDWNGDVDSDSSLAWGFRWDGAATGEHMLRAVVTHDPRLYAKVSSYGGTLGLALYGVGYDNGDEEFALDDGAFFDAAGLAEVDGPADGGASVDPADRYAEGWFDGYWNYGVSKGMPYSGGSWSYSPVGMSSRNLTDGDWDSWAYTATFRPDAYALHPLAATETLSADFTRDGIVDGADFLRWQQGVGATSGATREQGDANGDGAVDRLDLDRWTSQFGSTPDAMLNSVVVSGGAVHGAAVVVPESSAATLFVLAAGGGWGLFRRFLYVCKDLAS